MRKPESRQRAAEPAIPNSKPRTPFATPESVASAQCAGRLAWSFGIASFIAVSSGCLVAGSTGVGSGVWAINAAAWVIGAISSQLIARFWKHLSSAVLVLSPVALLITLLGSGQAGVHRWIEIGPVTANAAFLLLPAATVAFSAQAQSGSRWPWCAALVIQSELWLQPDASQATAFGAAAIITLVTMRKTGVADIAVGLFLAVAAALAWTRPDPLPPIPEVERIIELAAVRSGGLAAICVASLTAVTMSPLVVRKHVRSGANGPMSALFVYFLVCSLMPLFGAFPVPLVGMGTSPIVGFWLAIGALINLCYSTSGGPAQTRSEWLH